MKPDSRWTSLLVEMIGSAAICGMALFTDVLLGIRRRRTARA